MTGIILAVQTLALQKAVAVFHLHLFQPHDAKNLLPIQMAISQLAQTKNSFHKCPLYNLTTLN
jgi:hypothetical protein